MKTRALLAAAATSGLVLTPLGWIAPSDAQAAGPGAVSVVVFDRYSGDELSNIQVTLISTATGAVVATQTTQSGDPGHVFFEGLDVGTYTARAHDPSGAHPDKYSTGEVVTTDDAYQYAQIEMTPVGVDFGRLTGDVSQLTANNLGAYLEVYPSTVTTAAVDSGAADYVTRTYTAEYDSSDDGKVLTAHWQVNVAPGTYKVRAVDRSSQQCGYVDGSGYQCHYTRTAWVGGASAEGATRLAVTAGKSTATAATTLPGKEVNPAAAQRITGTVTGAAAARVDNVDVDLLEKLDDQWVQVASTETGADGTYGFAEAVQCEVVTSQEGTEYEYTDVQCDDYAPLDEGTFTLRFSDEASDGDDDYSTPSEYATVYFGNVAPDPAQPDRVPATAATVTLAATGSQTANATMSQLPFVTSSGLYGKLTDDRGTAHRGMIGVIDLSGNVVTQVGTRRNGTWSLPVTSLAPGQYKLVAYAEDLVAGWVGGRSFSAATTYLVPVKGSTNSGSNALNRYAQLSGRVAVTGVAGADAVETGVTIWDAKGRPIDTLETDAAGYYSSKVVPGTYLVSADGEAYSSFDVSDVEISRRPLIERFWKASWAVATATRIAAAPGASVGAVNLVLSNQLVATAAPRITGTPKVGKTLAVSVGAWNETENVTYSVVWKRGTKVISTKASYKVTKKDAKKVLTVTVTATDASGTYRAGVSAASVKIPKIPKK